MAQTANNDNVVCKWLIKGTNRDIKELVDKQILGIGDEGKPPTVISIPQRRYVHRSFYAPQCNSRKNIGENTTKNVGGNVGEDVGENSEIDFE